MRGRVCFTFLFSALLTAGSTSCRKADTSASVRIVTNRDAGLPTRFGAGELSKYLMQMGNPKPTLLESPETGDIYVGMIPNVFYKSDACYSSPGAPGSALRFSVVFEHLGAAKTPTAHAGARARVGADVPVIRSQPR